VDDSSSGSSSDDESDEKVGRIVEISDDALFKACGGMTGHKGARHGINMTAKLARIKQQEIEGLEKIRKLKEAQKAEKLKESRSSGKARIWRNFVKFFDILPKNSENFQFFLSKILLEEK